MQKEDLHKWRSEHPDTAWAKAAHYWGFDTKFV